LTGAFFRAFGDANPIVATMDAPRAIPLLSDLPLVGHAFFVQPIVALVAFATTPLTWWFLRHTHAGLALRAVGEDADAAAAAGINVTFVRWAAVVFGCVMGSVAGAALVLAQAGAFAENMSAGRGFLAIAIVALGRWRPLGIAGASLLFGAVMAIQFVVQALGWHVRYELALMIPYVLTLGALVFFGRGSAPAMLGRAIN
jgi:simple sugar transport system permease protein